MDFSALRAAAASRAPSATADPRAARESAALAEAFASARPQARTALAEQAVPDCSGEAEAAPPSARPVRILVAQGTSMGAHKGLCAVERLLEGESGHVDFLVLPEGFCQEIGPATAAEHPTLARYGALAQRFDTYILLGTFLERDGDEVYVTSALLGPDGGLVGAYRKRNTMSAALSTGHSPAVFDTRHGRVGVLICVDAEDDDFVAQTLALEPALILNPVHIPCRCGAYASFPELARSNWRSARATMGRRYSAIAARAGVAFLRCDSAFPEGHGSSMALTPDRTLLPPRMSNRAWCVAVSLGAARWPAPLATRTRTDEEDNVGVRAVRRELPLSLADDLFERDEEAVLAVAVAGGRVRAQLATRTVEWAVASGEQVPCSSTTVEAAAPVRFAGGTVTGTAGGDVVFEPSGVTVHVADDDAPVSALAAAASGSALVVSAGRTIYVLAVTAEGARVVRRWPVAREVTAMHLEPAMLVTGAAGEVCMWAFEQNRVGVELGALLSS